MGGPILSWVSMIVTESLVFSIYGVCIISMSRRRRYFLHITIQKLKRGQQSQRQWWEEQQSSRASTGMSPRWRARLLRLLLGLRRGREGSSQYSGMTQPGTGANG